VEEFQEVKSRGLTAIPHKLKNRTRETDAEVGSCLPTVKKKEEGGMSGIRAFVGGNIKESRLKTQGDYMLKARERKQNTTREKIEFSFEVSTTWWGRRGGGKEGKKKKMHYTSLGVNSMHSALFKKRPARWTTKTEAEMPS